MDEQDKANKTGLSALKNLKKRSKEKTIGWGPLSAVLVTLGIYFGAQIIAGLLIVQYLFGTGVSEGQIESKLNNSVMLQFSFILIVEAISIGALWLFLKQRQISWRQIGLRRPTGNNLLYALPAYAVYFAAILVVFALVKNFVPGIDVDQEQQVGFNNIDSSGPLLLVFASLVILPALVEEIMIRGFLYGGLRNKLPVITSALLASVIFGAAHLQLGSGASPLWIAAIDTFILSMVLIWLREKTGNIWAGVAVHMIKNSLAFIALFVLKTA